MALTDKLSAIGNAIRLMTGKEDLLTLDAMPTEIMNISTGSDEVIPDEAFVIKEDPKYKFAFNSWNWFLDSYGDQIITSDLTTTDYMFSNSDKISNLPNQLRFNFKENNNITCNYMFSSCGIESTPTFDFKQTAGSGYTTDLTSMFSDAKSLKEVGEIKNINIRSMPNMFKGSVKLRYLPTFTNVDFSYMNNNSVSMVAMFNNCYSLRSIDKDFLKKIYNLKQATSYSSQFYNTFYNCYALDEIVGVSPKTATLTSNAFTSTFAYCCRAKDIMFDVQEDGTPYKVNWKNQTITIAGCVGFALSASYLTSHNSGLTREENQVSNQESYDKLKNTNDWYSISDKYSRYNHDSAVNTINSLPDTSEYLSANGGNNTILFDRRIGTETDAGGVGTLTEEEIAVAVAKGWTVTFSN